MILVLVAEGVVIKQHSARIAELRQGIGILGASNEALVKHREIENSNFKMLFEADQTISEELRATRTRTDNAHTRIEYYRDVLLIVSKTCPGRMRLPRLDGDPGNKPPPK